MHRAARKLGDFLYERAEIACQTCAGGMPHQLFFENRFLEQALFRLKWEEGGAVYFGSDGGCLYYSADYILKRYMQEPKQLMMDYLHTVMHCLYQHPFFCTAGAEGILGCGGGYCSGMYLGGDVGGGHTAF